jgi:hypothetical protein
VFAPERGVENPIIRRAIELCDQSGMRVLYHEDTVEVWFAPDKKRFYTTWSQFLADAETIFGARMHEAPETEVQTPPRPIFGHRRSTDGEPATSTNAGATNGATAPQPGLAEAPARFDPPAPADAGELTRLRNEIRILERAIKVVGMQAEEWKREVAALREEIDTTRAEAANMAEARAALAGTGPDRYKMARQIIVRRLHPDIPGTDEEKSYRERLFKSIWQDIEALDKRG